MILFSGARAADVLRIEAPVIDPARHDGGLPLAPGVENIAVFRASRLRPDLTDGKGYIYNHHPDLAGWRGRLYVAWDSGEKDEDTWPAHQLYSTSTDGRTWTAPAELFPQGVSTPLRLYFFHAPNDRMLAFAGLRLNHDKTDEAKKGPLVVREIRVDHTLGPVFTLRPPAGDVRSTDPMPFTSSADAAFVAACRSLLAARVALETQDYGLLLDADVRSRWHDAANWRSGKLGNGFWKAPSFFHRTDGAIVGIGKNGWTSLSTDDGVTWSQPVVPPTLVTNNAKVWGQRTSDGHYALVYNPAPRARFPLAIVASDDGIAFGNMRTVQEDFPAQRYPGLNKNVGLQYVRGISEWASDGSWPDAQRALWLVYSANKEDIWVSRVPLAARATAWSLYVPKWSHVAISPDDARVTLENREPSDCATATRLFVPAGKLSLTFALARPPSGRGLLEIELGAATGGVRPLQLHVTADGAVLAASGKTSTKLTVLSATAPTQFEITVDAATQKLSVTIDGKRKSIDADFAASSGSPARLAFHLWSLPNASLSVPVSPDRDQPTEPATCQIDDIRIDGRP